MEEILFFVQEKKLHAQYLLKQAHLEWPGFTGALNK
jgi:hypothetical protein